jgi:hypothetical protein
MNRGIALFRRRSSSGIRRTRGTSISAGNFLRRIVVGAIADRASRGPKSGTAELRYSAGALSSLNIGA